MASEIRAVDDQAYRYSGIVAAIHWTSAALILAQIWLGFTFHDLPKGTPERAFYFGWHKTVGVIILLLALARLGVRLMRPEPSFPADMAGWQRPLAVWSHRLLYFLIVALPLTGLMLVSKGGTTTDLNWGLQFPTIPTPSIGEAHEALAWSMIVLLVIHVLAALRNQFTIPSLAGRMPPFPRKG